MKISILIKSFILGFLSLSASSILAMQQPPAPAQEDIFLEPELLALLDALEAQPPITPDSEAEAITPYLPELDAQEDEYYRASSQNKKRKHDDEASTEDKQVTPVYPQVYFDPEEIKNVMKGLFMNEEGKILASYYLVTSDELTDCWIARKYMQALKKAQKNNNLTDTIAAAKLLTSPKEDIVIVDQENLRNAQALQKLNRHGISVLIRCKKREPAFKTQKMHHKFMIIFDEKNQAPKLMVKGCYNLTNAAESNFEDIEVTDNQRIIQRFLERHIALREYCINYKELPQNNSLLLPIK